MKPSAIVTGGASGIGLAAAEWLLDDGWPVAVLDADRQALAAAEDMLAGENAVFLFVDVTDEEEVAEAFDQAVDALGPVGGLVNAAGVSCDLPAMETSAELFRQVLDVNLVAAFVAAKAAVERMGDTLSIVNVASVSGLRGSHGRLAHGASKAGVRLM
ncbi:MAG: SDR family oxidoreductase, partial [Aquamicrobium sp.]|nr:SDR family oxidoreductase [Aquamicrobium sp.]